MRFIDELYEFYKDKLIADEEDIDIITATIMQEMSREDILLLFAELSYDDLYQLMGKYISEKLKEKMINNGHLDFYTSADHIVH